MALSVTKLNRHHHHHRQAKICIVRALVDSVANTVKIWHEQQHITTRTKFQAQIIFKIQNNNKAAITMTTQHQ